MNKFSEVPAMLACFLPVGIEQDKPMNAEVDYATSKLRH